MRVTVGVESGHSRFAERKLGFADLQICTLDPKRMSWRVQGIELIQGIDY
jgi:hypothetical protein